jgi:hypothetical protein
VVFVRFGYDEGILGLWALFSLDDLEVDDLGFLEVTPARTTDPTEVNEDVGELGSIGIRGTFDEAVAFVGCEPLDDAEIALVLGFAC